MSSYRIFLKVVLKIIREKSFSPYEYISWYMYIYNLVVFEKLLQISSPLPSNPLFDRITEIIERQVVRNEEEEKKRKKKRKRKKGKKKSKKCGNKNNSNLAFYSAKKQGWIRRQDMLAKSIFLIECRLVHIHNVVYFFVTFISKINFFLGIPSKLWSTFLFLFLDYIVDQIYSFKVYVTKISTFFFLLMEVSKSTIYCLIKPLFSRSLSWASSKGGGVFTMQSQQKNAEGP